jgi:hypothetical protein
MQFLWLAAEGVAIPMSIKENFHFYILMLKVIKNRELEKIFAY